MTRAEERFRDALRGMHREGTTRICADALADALWPGCRHNNSNGQSFNLASGIAGRMLRRWRGCHEVGNRVWEIVPEVIDP